MKLDIRTAASEPRRQTYGYLARRFGEDRPASRYEEAVLGIQSTENFHYRPAANPSKELFDRANTKIVLDDWDSLLDPRQLYYATYNISRAALEANASKMFDVATKHGAYDPSAILPLRHYEWGANRIAWSICDRGFGAPITSAAAFAAMDRLGIAQHLTKLALAYDPATIDTAKTAWMDAPAWQPLRRATEDMLVLDDWFEAFVALFVAFDPVIYQRIDAARTSLPAIMATDMFVELRADHARWATAIVKIAASASPHNADLIQAWTTHWTARAKETV